MRWARSASIAAFSVGVGRICFAQESPFEKRFGKPKNEVLTMEEFFIRLSPPFALADSKASERLKKAVQKKLLSVADLNGNSKIDLAEFVFFSLLMSLSLKEAELAFRVMDTDNSNSLDAGEFSAMLKAATGFTGMVHQPKFAALFGKDGKKKVSLTQFKQWLLDIKKEVAQLEFQMMDFNDDGKLTMFEFGKSVVGSDAAFNAALLDLKAEDEDVSFDEYWAFRQVSERFDEVHDAVQLFLSQNETVSRSHLKRAVAAVTGTNLSDSVIQALSILFNNNGRINTHHLATILHNQYGLESTAEKPSFTTCLGNCWGSEITRREARTVKD